VKLLTDTSLKIMMNQYITHLLPNYRKAVKSARNRKIQSEPDQGSILATKYLEFTYRGY
jgi:hypothetical protein